jgi:hypothetical protein
MGDEHGERGGQGGGCIPEEVGGLSRYYILKVRVKPSVSLYSCALKLRLMCGVTETRGKKITVRSGNSLNRLSDRNYQN